jgi:hypothetical protein
MKFLFKPPSPNPIYWILLVEGIIFTIIFSPWFFDGSQLIMILGLQFMAIGSAEVLSTAPKMSGWLRIISIVFLVVVLVMAASDPVWSR